MVNFVVLGLGALDLHRAAALHARSFMPLGERPWTRQDFAGLLASPGVAGLLLGVDGNDAGLALYRVAADEAELLTIAVQPGYRRQGGARCLLSAVVDHVREAGARALFLEVGVDNPAARKLYESVGFSVVGSRRDYYRRGGRPAADGMVMKLDMTI